ncbi:MAG: hypothetical protein P9M11_11240 [Candidatus Tenebribacter burtonii]|jgi:ppGpp synthetase/RelA/SpoT-type nucleotidyltranferase|nr:hypothetical protein [Candidatus Tenebribacter burtonii]
MSIDIKNITESWEKDKLKFEKLGKLVYPFIKSNITEFEILPEISFRTKELLSIIKKIKRKLKSKTYSYSSLNDKLGIRIICSFQEEMELIDIFIRKYFIIKRVEYKKEELNFDTLGYISNHYDVSINNSIDQFKKHSKYKTLIFEIQVRTLNQHAWSNAAHALSYKQDSMLPDKLNRRIYRLLSLYEIADDEISTVNNILKEDPDNYIYTVLKKLEGKIYKYAKIDFDRDTSINAIRILSGYFSEVEKKSLLKEIDNFIITNQEKIQRIFNENRNRFHEIPFLTQPEIFIIWFGLDKFSFSIDDNWINDFDICELKQIKTLWGRVID